MSNWRKEVAKTDRRPNLTPIVSHPSSRTSSITKSRTSSGPSEDGLDGGVFDKDEPEDQVMAARQAKSRLVVRRLGSSGSGQAARSVPVR